MSYKAILAQTTSDSHFNIPYYPLAKEQIILWKQNIKNFTNKNFSN